MLGVGPLGKRHGSSLPVHVGLLPAVLTRSALRAAVRLFSSRLFSSPVDPNGSLRSPFCSKKESVGLIANRIWAAIKRESLLVVAEGVADPSDVDGLMMAISNFTQHPFKTMDRVGLDVVLDIEKHYLEVRKDLSDDAAKFLERKIKENPGDLGMKTGKGFYDHGGRK